MIQSAGEKIEIDMKEYHAENYPPRYSPVEETEKCS